MRKTVKLMRFQNAMEDFVTQKTDEVWNSLNCCKCDKCKEDVISCALNRLAPHYVSTELGKAFVKVNTMSNQFEIDILTAIYEGAEIVRKHPHHDVPAGK
jgi:competence protein ComFB